MTECMFRQQCRNQMNFWKRARAAQAARKKQQQALLHKKPVGPGNLPTADQMALLSATLAA